MFPFVIMAIFDSWGSGANIWGPEKDEKFTKPNHWDGMLEVVGVQGNYLVRFHSEDPFHWSLFELYCSSRCRNLFPLNNAYKNMQ